ncbi:MAG: LapA family protein [Nocardioides alkalitolerans]
MTVPQASPAGDPAVPPTAPPPPPPPPKDAERPHDDPLRGSRTSGLWIGAVALGVLLLLLVVFIAQNTEQTTVRFFGFEGRAPLAVSLLIATAAGILLTAIAGSLRIWQLRRRTRKEVGREPHRARGRR